VAHTNDISAEPIINELQELYRAPVGEPRISIVIVSYSRADEIEHCLADLAAQRTTVKFEVLLLLQAYPRGATDRLVTTFSHAFPLHVFHATQGLGVHVARNAALARTSADIIAWCRAHLAHFKAPTSVVFGALPKTATGKIQKYVLRGGAKGIARQ